jgi:tetratricopeptide (TPR) repeat protein
MALILFLVFSLTTSDARSDQNDERLDDLFNTLQSDDSNSQARKVVNRIWTIWIESPNTDINTKMSYGISAMGRYDLISALDIFDAVVDKAPEFAEGWNKRATIHFLLGQYKSSMGDIHKVLSLEPRHFGALSGMGLIFMETGNDDRAIKAFQAALKINPYMPNIQKYIVLLKEKIERNTI